MQLCNTRGRMFNYLGLGLFESQDNGILNTDLTLNATQQIS